MKTNKNTATATTSTTTTAATTAAVTPKGVVRLNESRDLWSTIFAHTVALITTCARGEVLDSDCRKGFGFESVKTQPHARAYAQSLLAGFCSKKASKPLADIDNLREIEDRKDVAVKILLATKLGGSDVAKAKALLAKADPKQAKAVALAVIEALNVPKETTPTPKETTPTPASKKTTPTPKKTTRKKSTGK